MIIMTSGEFPIPAASGSKIEILNSLRIIRDANIDVHLVVIAKADPPQALEATRILASELQFEVTSLERRSNISGLLSQPWRSIQLSTRDVQLPPFAGGPREVTAILAHGLFVLPASYRLSKYFEAPLHLRSHNVESAYSKGLARSTSNVFLKAHFKSEAVKLAFTERFWMHPKRLHSRLDLTSADLHQHNKRGRCAADVIPLLTAPQQVAVKLSPILEPSPSSAASIFRIQWLGSNGS